MPTPPDLNAVFNTVRAWVDAIYPGHSSITIVIDLPGRTPARIAVPPGVTAGQQTPEPFRHSADFREVVWHGTRFHFSKMQAAVVETLFLAREAGSPDVDQEDLVRASGTESVRLVDLFRRTASATAWGALIVKGDTPGTLRLAE